MNRETNVEARLALLPHPLDLRGCRLVASAMIWDGEARAALALVTQAIDGASRHSNPDEYGQLMGCFYMLTSLIASRDHRKFRRSLHLKRHKPKRAA